MEATAIAKRLRLTAQKARLVVDMVRGKPVAQALDILNFANQKGAVRSSSIPISFACSSYLGPTQKIRRIGKRSVRPWIGTAGTAGRCVGACFRLYVRPRHVAPVCSSFNMMRIIRIHMKQQGRGGASPRTADAGGADSAPRHPRICQGFTTARASKAS